MGIVKIYNVLGGFYGYYSIMIATISVHKLHKNHGLFLCNLYSTLVIFNIFYIVIVYKNIVVFKYYVQLLFCCPRQTVLQTHLL